MRPLALQSADVYQLTLTPGTRLGPYEITAPLGAGGMGEVYRATDTNLKRQVAIKVLPASVASDGERLARFQREAEVLATLNHPNIAHIHGLEKSEGTLALVMELVEGPTLADRLASGSGLPASGQRGLPIDEALAIARQIAEALEAAHEQGIIHRDLKPANIKVRADGVTKILDFGLAKLAQAADSGLQASGEFTQSPTITTPAMTQAGIILGTAAYMSPEQARGKAVDKRTDIWAFGCVLFEMLSGRRPFDGEEVTDVIVSVISKEPEWQALPAGCPPSIQRLLARCLVKDRMKRLPDIGVARFELDEPINPEWPAHRAKTPARETRLQTRERLAWTAAAVGLGLVVWAGAALLFRTPPPQPELLRFSVPPPPGTQFTGAVAVSPDSRRILFRATGADGAQLWIRDLAASTATAVPGTRGATFPFWAPDGAAIAFFQEAQLVRLSLAGGNPQVLSPASSGSNAAGSWGANGSIIFFTADVIHSISASASGEVRQPVTVLDENRGDIRHGNPVFLPDGRQFLFTVVARDTSRSGVYLGSVDSKTTTMLEAGATIGSYAAPGYLLFGRGSSLFARRFDVSTGQVSGDPVALDTQIFTGEGITRSFLGASQNVVAYVTGVSSFALTQLSWLSRDGTRVGTFGSPMPMHTFDLAPDESRVAVERSSTAESGADIWLIDGTRGTAPRLTTEPTAEGHPVWSPDGKNVAYFAGTIGGTTRLMTQPSSGLVAPSAVVTSTSGKQTTDWNGDTLVYEELSRQTSWDIAAASISGKGSPRLVLHTPFQERQGKLSPDGRFLAYTSNDTGQPEVYVVRFPDLTEKWPISTGGGTSPRWRSDGRELFYLGPDGELMAVSVNTQAELQPGPAAKLFTVPGLMPTDGWNYAVSKKGDRFLFMQRAENASREDTSMTVIFNWAAALAPKH